MTEAVVKELVEKYPFLLPRNVFTDKIPDNYDYTYIKPLEIPEGWYKLFFQMCEDIRQSLIDNNYLDKFRFTQIKEKYNMLRCYHNGAPEEVDKIISKYEHMATYICIRCGKPAIYETRGYVTSFCEDCWKDIARHNIVDLLEFVPYYKVTVYSNGKHYKETVSFEDEWNRYLASINYQCK